MNNNNKQLSASQTIGFLVGSMLASIVPMIVGIFTSFVGGVSSGAAPLKDQINEAAAQAADKQQKDDA